MKGEGLLFNFQILSDTDITLFNIVYADRLEKEVKSDMHKGQLRKPIFLSTFLYLIFMYVII